MAPPYGYDNAQSTNRSFSIDHIGNLSTLRPISQGNAEKKNTTILRHITAQINASIHKNSGYEYYPEPPYGSNNNNNSTIRKPHHDDSAGEKPLI